MRGIEPGTVQTCVTSPPYFGLRDYQTATWEGGDPGCDHKPSSTPGRRGLASSTLAGGKATTGCLQTGYGGICPRCGAIRIDQQIGLEDTPDAYVAKLVDVFREVRRLLRDDGTLWLNLGDSYNGSGGAGGDYGAGGLKEGQPKYPGRRVDNLKAKDLIGIPWMVAFALRADGWWLRSDIIWHKPNPMPESVTDRPTKAHEYIFLLTKSSSYYYDADAIKEPSVTNDTRRPYGSKGAWDMDGRPEEQRHGGEQRSKRDTFKREGSKRAQVIPGQSVGTHRPNRDESQWDIHTRNRRSVWTVTTKPYAEAHFATYPPDLIEPCILAGSKPGDIVLDPFNGSGTTGAVALKHGRHYIGCELNPDYIELAQRRIQRAQPLLMPVY
ncbi:MAG: site-specific DNA-methyltransferase [Caldilineaceae bacterium]|nr:site-specific DNA-methyltransferase [Caldilineaceae bacterium]